MKSTDEFLAFLCSLDVKLWVDGVSGADPKDLRLRCSAPKDALTPVLKAELAERKAEILAYICKTNLALSSTPQPIQSVTRKKNLPLSFAQQRLWFIDQLEPGHSLYNIPTALYLKGSLNVTALEQTLNEVTRRHEALRTTFTSIEGQPVQVITSILTLPLPLVNLQDLPESKREAEVLRLVIDEAQRPFNLAYSPLLRATLVHLSEVEYVMMFTMHHIVSDGWSMGILIQEVAALYEAFCKGQPSPLPELPIQYADFAVWQRQWLQGEVLEAQLVYWQKQLGSSLPVLQLPTDRPRPRIQTFRGATKSFSLTTNLTEVLKALSRNENVTLFMTLLAAFKALLHRYTGQHDILVGSPIANRNRNEIERLIGFFVNTLVLRTDLSGNPSFRELLGRIREVTLGAYAHQDLPLEYLMEDLQPERNLSYNPLFQVMFILQNASTEELKLPDLTLSPLKLEMKTAKFDLTLSMEDSESGLNGVFEYNTDLFDTATISRMGDHFCTLLSSIVANPDGRICNLPLLTEPERHQLLVEWNKTQGNYPQEQCIHKLFEAQVERSPDAIAVVFEDQQLTYQELNQRANRLAHYLRSLGVKPEVLVGICMERSLEMVIGLLAILKAGGAYVPLDPMYPPERLAFMLENADIFILLTEKRLAKRLPEHKGYTICLDADCEAIAQHSQENPVSGVTPDNLIYVIYTSGSTGKPKGAGVYQRSFTNLMNWFVTEFDFTCNDRVLLISSLSFDLTQKNIYAPLLVGGELHLLSSGCYDAAQIVESVSNKQVTWLNCTPSAFYPLIDQGDKSLCMKKTLKYVFLGGEPISISSLKVWLDSVPCKTQIVNTYGPTECTDICAAYRVAQPEQWLEKLVPIGKPIHNAKVYVLDENLKPLPVGMVGELYVGGEGVGRGYINNIDLTLAKFVCDPFSNKPGARLYKSGDLARYLPDGNIEYLGRIDNQVKIRGFRIELGEIEVAINQYPAVKETVVVVSEESVNSKRLVAYLVPQKQQTLTIPELRSFLESKLPNYMVPAAFMMLQALPLTPNGKIDRKALPALEVTQLLSESDFIAPSTPIEEMLAGIWAEVLGIEKVGIHDNFFELGGHSLLATRVISQVRQVFEVELPLRCLFEEPTIAGIAKDIEKAIKAGLGLETPPLKPIYRSQELPLSFAQQRLWFSDQLQPGNSAYNISSAIGLFGWVNVAALEQSFNEVVRRHEVLRTTFTARDGQAIQVIAPSLDFKLSVVNLQELPKDKREAEVLRLAIEEAQQPFDLAKGSLLRVTLLRQTETESALLLTMHHIISDGWSMGVLVSEMTALYEAFSCGKPSPLPELPIQYADFAVWQRKWLQGEQLETHLAYWQQQLGSKLPILELLTDRPRPTIQTLSGARETLVLPKTLAEKLKALNQRQGITLFMILLAAFQTLLFWYTGQEDIIVGTDIANRNQAEIKGLIGFFVNQLVLRTDLSGNPTFLELLERVREMALEAYNHQDMPFDKLVDALNPKRELNRSPLFQVKIVLNNTQTPFLELPDLTINPLKVENKTVQFDLLLELNETDKGLFCVWKYNTDLFDTGSIVQMSRNFEILLGKISTHPEAKLNELKITLSEAEKQHNIAKEQVYQNSIKKKLMNVKRRNNSRL